MDTMSESQTDPTLADALRAAGEIEDLLMLVEEFRGRIHPMNSHPGYTRLPDNTQGRLVQLSAQAHTVTEDLDRLYMQAVERAKGLENV